MSKSLTLHIFIIIFALAGSLLAEDGRFLYSYQDLPINVEVGNVFAADLDNNGALDIIAINYYGTVLYIFQGHEHGRFTLLQTLELSTYYSDKLFEVTAGDVDGDGFADVILASEFNDNTYMTILLNNGDGTVSETPVNYPIDNDGTAIVTFDIDEDDDLDIAMATTYHVSVFLNNGDGTFAPRIDYSCGDSWNYGLDMGDFNGDSYIDLLTSNYNVDSLRVLINDGNGAFTSVVSLGCYHALDVIAVDVDLNNFCDIVAVTYPGEIVIFPGNGDGTFSDSVVYPAGNRCNAVNDADFDQDGYPDLVVNGNASLTVSVFLNDGTGSFNAGSVALADPGNSVMVGDIDQDDYPDIIVPNNFEGSGRIMIMTNDQNGEFPMFEKFDCGGNTNAQGICAADFDGDDNIDLAIAGGSGNEIIVAYNNDGLFEVDSTYAVGTMPYYIIAADLNNDNSPDLVTANHNSDNISVQMNDGNGKFNEVPVQYTAGDGPYFVAAGLFDNDDYLDLAVSNEYSDNVSVLLNNGDGTFASAVNYDAGGGPHAIALDDFNDDGQADLVIADYDQWPYKMTMLLGVGDGTFIPGTDIPMTCNNEGVVPLDFSNDGIPDLVAFHDEYALLFFENNGDGTFAEPDSMRIYGSPYLIFKADINADEYEDVCLAHYFWGMISVFLNSGNGYFYDPQHYNISDYSRPACAADFDNDGDPDIAVASSNATDPDFYGVLWNRNEQLGTGIDENNHDLLPGNFILSQNYPNPFNPTTIIEYTLSSKMPVEIEIINILGQTVTAIDEGIKTAGKYSCQWDGRDQSGRTLPSGVYLYQIRTDRKTEAKKMLLLK
ncbi:MAG: FG-GAP-like repeat-containing protein [Candidatus Zixiibacteriota bacterium]